MIRPTRRERELAELISKGRVVKEAAEEMGIAHKTATTHLSNLHKRLESRNLGQMVRVMIENGWMGVEK
jgi:DNA-binding NarL/FixJ family response regulator